MSETTIRRLTRSYLGSSLWRRITRNFSISVAGSGTIMVAGIFRTALLTKSISVSEYGRLLIVLNVFTFLNAFVGVRTNDLVYTYFHSFERQNQHTALGALLKVCLWTAVGISSFIAVSVFVMADWIA